MLSQRQVRATEFSASSRKRYDSDDTKKRLLRAALNIFSKVGYEAATTRVIAKSAGVNESLIHRYFKNKLGLFFAVLREYHHSLTRSLPYDESDNVKEEIAKFMLFRREFSRRNKKFLRLLIARAILDPKVRVEMGALSRNGVPGLVDRFKRLQKKGALADSVNLEHLSLLLTGVTFSIAMFTEVISTLDPKIGDAVIDLAVQLVSGALDSTGSK